MAESSINISYYPAAKASGDELEKRLGAKHLHLPQTFLFDEIRASIDALTGELGANNFDHESKIEECIKRLSQLRNTLGETKISIDYTAVSRPFGLAKLLCEYGLNVFRIYADSISAGDKSAFLWLKENFPEIEIFATVHPKMRVLPRESCEKTLAIGQKAAYFTGTQNFVNIVEGGGHWGYDGILKICDEMEDAFLNEKDAKKLIQIKGLGCGCC